MNRMDFVLSVYMDSLLKAARVNIVTGEYEFVKSMDEEVQNGLLDLKSMDEYPEKIVENGWIHPDDVWDYLYHMRLEYLREKIREGTRRFVHSFRRKIDENYPWITVCIALPNDFTWEDPWVSYTWREADNNSRNMEDALYMLSSLFHKILKVNLTRDSFDVIKVYKEELTMAQGYSPKISEWLRGFAETGNVHEDDMEDYLRFTNINTMRQTFRRQSRMVRCRYRRKMEDGYHWVMMTLLPSVEYTQEKEEIMLYVRDINDEYVEEQEHRKELEYYCYNDILTNMGNRRQYKKICAEYAQLEEKPRLAVLFADINGLKYVNDHLGHDAGDEYIKRFGKQLMDAFSGSECCRISGDEFIVVMEDVPEAEAAAKFEAFIAQIKKDDPPIAAIGYACAEKPESIPELMSVAEAVMYEDKKNCHQKHPEYRRFVENFAERRADS